MKISKKYLFFIFIICNSVCAAADFLPLRCLANYKNLLVPVEEIELRDGMENSKIKLSGLSEYHDILPQSCSSELGQGELKIVELNHKIFIFNLVLFNTDPVILKNFSAPKSAMIEVGIKRNKLGSQIIKTSLSNESFQYILSKTTDNKYIEYLLFKSLETANYE
jgi:hypothetical protein